MSAGFASSVCPARAATLSTATVRLPACYVPLPPHNCNSSNAPSAAATYVPACACINSNFRHTVVCQAGLFTRSYWWAPIAPCRARPKCSLHKHMPDYHLGSPARVYLLAVDACAAVRRRRRRCVRGSRGRRRCRRWCRRQHRCPRRRAVCGRGYLRPGAAHQRSVTKAPQTQQFSGQNGCQCMLMIR